MEQTDLRKLSLVSTKGKVMPRKISLIFFLSFLAIAAHAQGDVANVTQLHIRLKAQTQHTPKTPLTANEAADLSATAGVNLTPTSVTPDNAQLVGLPRAMTRAEAWAIANKLSARPDIEHVEPIDPEFNKRPPNNPTGLH